MAHSKEQLPTDAISISITEYGGLVSIISNGIKQVAFDNLADAAHYAYSLAAKTGLRVA